MEKFGKTEKKVVVFIPSRSPMGSPQYSNGTYKNRRVRQNGHEFDFQIGESQAYLKCTIRK